MAEQPAAEERPGGLELSDDPALQRLTWRIQRICWCGVLLMLLAALLGVFSRGVLSEAAVRSPDGSIAVAYERFARANAPMTLAIELATDVLPDGLVQFSLSRDYLREVEVIGINPPAARVALAADRSVYAFHVAESGRPLPISIHVVPLHAGLIDGTLLREPDGAGVRVRHIVYP